MDAIKRKANNTNVDPSSIIIEQTLEMNEEKITNLPLLDSMYKTIKRI
jgi:hypothetical protein